MVDGGMSCRAETANVSELCLPYCCVVWCVVAWVVNGLHCAQKRMQSSAAQRVWLCVCYTGDKSVVFKSAQRPADSRYCVGGSELCAEQCVPTVIRTAIAALPDQGGNGLPITTVPNSAGNGCTTHTRTHRSAKFRISTALLETVLCWRTSGCYALCRCGQPCTLLEWAAG